MLNTKRIWIGLVLLLIAVGITAGVGFQAGVARRQAAAAHAALAQQAPHLVVQSAQRTAPED